MVNHKGYYGVLCITLYGSDLIASGMHVTTCLHKNTGTPALLFSTCVDIENDKL